MGKKQVAKLARRGPARPERHVIAVFSEGEVTEPEYLNALARLPEVRSRTRLSLRIDLVGAVPLTLVEAAVAEKRSDTANEYWCVFDVEWPRHHPKLQEAMSLADQHGIEIAISNPSFELWLVLHHQNQTAFLDNDGARRLRRELDGSADKHLDPERYLPQRAAAATRAAALQKLHERNGSVFPQNNPMTTMHRLVSSVENAPPA